MSLLIAVVASLGALQGAVAQDEFRSLDGRPLSITLPAMDKADGYNEMTLGIRIPFLGGKMDNGGDDWSDIFGSPGVGFNIDGSFLWTVSPKVAVGIYTAFSMDFFGGESDTVDVGGGPVDIKYDDLLMTRFVVGGRVRETFGHFFMDQSLGFGFATYSQTDADAGGITVGIIDSSVVFAFELTFRLGFVVSRVVDLGMSLAYNYNGAPDVSSDLTAVDPGMKFKAQSNTVIGFFINLNF